MNEFLNIAPEGRDEIRGECDGLGVIQNDIEGTERKVEKISKEELMKKLGMTEEEMGKVSGGESLEECYARVDAWQMACLGKCGEGARACRHNCYSTWEHERFVCHSQYGNR